MIKAPAKARPKPRPKKPTSAAKQDDANEGGSGPAGAEKAGVAKDAKLPKPKRRRPPPKKKDIDSDGADGHHKDRADERKHKLSSHLQFLHGQDDHHYYERAPRLLPEIPGVKSLSLTEINSDIKHIQSALNVFEAKMTALLPPGSNHHGGSKHRVDMFDDDDDDASIDMAYGFKPRRARPNGVITPEEVVESLPICRRAVRITQRELAVMKRERDDLERDFMRLRCKYVYHVSEMKKMQKQQDRITRVLSRDVVKIAKSLESSRRRTNALQDIMTELETRGSSIIRLTREKHQLETILKKNEITLPEIEEVYVGDRVECSLGKGQVLSMDEDTRILVVDMDHGGRAYVQESEVEVLPAEVTYLDVEKELKQTFFEKIGALVQSNGRFVSHCHGRNTSGDQELGGGAGENVMYGNDSGDDDDDDDDEESGEDEDGNDSGKNADSDTELPKQKKRKLMMMTASSSSSSTLKKKQKYQRVIDYPACTIPITPYETGLLLSPLSTLPDRVAAVGPNALQWKDSYLPSRMHEWEQERYESLQMKGEIERLRFQLQRAEAEKLDAQQHASDQLESINQLVAQLDKLRDVTSATSNGGNLQSSNSSNSANNQCPTCSNGTGNVSRKNSSSSVKNSKSNAKSSHKKDAGKRQHGENLDDELQEVLTDEKNDKKSKNDSPEHEGDDGVEHDAKEGKDVDHDDVDAGAESSDGASSKPTTRSLRPRRKPTSNSTTASPKQSK
ncbi:hypothetical protein FI667_g10952, partial [Globisporangium splendens]